MAYSNIIYRVFSSAFLFIALFILITQYLNYLNICFYIIYLVIFCEIIIYFRKYNLVFFISIFYFLTSLICFKLYFDYFFNLEKFLFTIAIITVFDISSYFFGISFGKSKMFPKISPNKTYFVFFSGFFITIIVALIFNYFFNIINKKIVFFFIIIIIFSSFLGDLLESIFKRNSGIKNSGILIPGHGGFFDRFDSFLMSINSLYLYSYFFEYYVKN